MRIDLQCCILCARPSPPLTAGVADVHRSAVLDSRGANRGAGKLFMQASTVATKEQHLEDAAEEIQVTPLR